MRFPIADFQGLAQLLSRPFNCLFYLVITITYRAALLLCNSVFVMVIGMTPSWPNVWTVKSGSMHSAMVNAFVLTIAELINNFGNDKGEHRESSHNNDGGGSALVSRAGHGGDPNDPRRDVARGALDPGSGRSASDQHCAIDIDRAVGGCG